MKHPSILRVDRAAYRANLGFFMEKCRPARVCAVVKANAYGHGLVECARVAVDAGVAALGIVDNSEAEALRGAEVGLPLMRLRPAEIDEARAAGSFDIEECVGDLDAAEAMARWGRERGRAVRYHLKLDVGMGRAGIDALAQAAVVERILTLDGLRNVGVMTHFPCADESGQRITVTQGERFHRQVEALRDWLPPDVLLHTANSATCLRFPDLHLSLVRPGIASYGLEPGPECPLPAALKPVLSWHTTLVQVRELPAGATVGYGMTHKLPKAARVGTLPIGYANGYDRRLANKGQVLVCGKRCPVIGRVSMDLVNIDLSTASEASVGDEATLLGERPGGSISAAEMAEWMGTITYEIATNLGRAERSNRFEFVS